MTFPGLWALVLGVLLAVPGPVLPVRPADDGAAFVRRVLTDEGARYAYMERRGGVEISAPPSERDWNRREVFARPSAEVTRDQTSCATWAAQSSDMVQEGLAVRIRRSGGAVSAVTLTKNTIFGVHWVFNLLTWDTARRGDPWRSVGQFTMARAVGAGPHRLFPLPWRACLRVDGRRVSFKVWPQGRVGTPSWRDPVHARHARLPLGFTAAGRPGWYVGHLAAGERVVYRGLVAGSG